MSVNNSQQNASSSLRHSMHKENIAKGTWNKLNNFQSKGITTPVHPFSALKKKTKNQHCCCLEFHLLYLKPYILLSSFLTKPPLSASWKYHRWHMLPTRAICPPVCCQESGTCLAHPGEDTSAVPGQGLWESQLHFQLGHHSPQCIRMYSPAHTENPTSLLAVWGLSAAPTRSYK